MASDGLSLVILLASITTVCVKATVHGKRSHTVAAHKDFNLVFDNDQPTHSVMLVGLLIHGHSSAQQQLVAKTWWVQAGEHFPIACTNGLDRLFPRYS